MKNAVIDSSSLELSGELLIQPEGLFNISELTHEYIAWLFFKKSCLAKYETLGITFDANEYLKDFKKHKLKELPFRALEAILQGDKYGNNIYLSKILSEQNLQ